jgi:hypothetical protein
VDDPDIKGRIMTALNRYLKSRPTDESPE